MRAVRVGLVILACLIISAFTQYAFAHDGTWGSVEDPCGISGFGTDYEMDFLHNDADPWKGWASVIAINWCGGPDWGDFHLRMKEVCSPWSTSDVDFITGGEFDPELYIWGGLSVGWVQQTVDNAILGSDGETLDLFFYSNPVENGQIALIKFYTDNTSHHSDWFKVSGYATPVPEPATIALLGLGAIALIRRSKRHN